MQPLKSVAFTHTHTQCFIVFGSFLKQTRNDAANNYTRKYYEMEISEAFSF